MNEIIGEKKKEDLDRFPDGITVGANDHGAADGAIVGELGVGDDVEIPGVEVLRPWGYETFLVRQLLLLLLLFACEGLGGVIAR